MHLDHDETMHTHTHTHADGTTHTHAHHHHENFEDHEHHASEHDCAEHIHCEGDCAACQEQVSPREELMALMKYMVGHNASHANELAKLAGQLKELGEDTAYEQIMLAVSDFEKGNLRLSTVLAAMNA